MRRPNDDCEKPRRRLRQCQGALRRQKEGCGCETPHGWPRWLGISWHVMQYVLLGNWWDRGNTVSRTLHLTASHVPPWSGSRYSGEVAGIGM